jgi:hypothetical protein
MRFSDGCFHHCRACESAARSDVFFDDIVDHEFESRGIKPWQQRRPEVSFSVKQLKLIEKMLRYGPFAGPEGFRILHWK